MIQETAGNCATCRPQRTKPDGDELAQARLIALNLACEAAAARTDASEMQVLAERAAAIESLLRQVWRDR
ncbi:MAG: hypothetical protein MOGDAGHF_02911 [Rhodocyclaceae bacterium]|jgi:hypothetical protein|nr:hypothetical protein [Rhodocyclaceae bacterium]